MKIKTLLRSKKGFSSAPLAVVIALVGMMFFVVLWQIVRLITNIAKEKVYYANQKIYTVF